MDTDVLSATRNFNETLQDQWMTSDVLINTLKEYSNEETEIGKKAFAAAQDVKTFTQMMDTLKESAQSGWAETFQLILGDFDEAKTMWTEVAGAIGGVLEASANARNSMLRDWKDLGGRTALLQAVANAFENLCALAKPVKEAFRDIFPAMTGERLYALTVGLRDFIASLKISEETADKLRRTCAGLFAIFDIIGTVTGGIIYNVMNALGQVVGGLDLDILGLTANIGDAIVRIRDWIDEHNIFVKGINALVKGLQTAIPVIRNWIQQFFSLPQVRVNLDRFRKAFEETFANFGAYFEGGKEQIRAFLERVKSLDSFSLENVKAVLKDFRDNVLGYFFNFDGLFDSLKEALSAFGADIGASLSGAKDKAKNTFDQIVQFMVNLRDNLFRVATDIRTKLADKIGFGEIFAIGIGTALVVFVKKISDALTTLAAPFEGFGNVLTSASKALKAFALEMKAKALLTAAQAILILVGALAVLVGVLTDIANLDISSAGKTVTLLLGAMAGLALVATACKNVKMGAAATILAIVLSLKMLAGCFETVAGIDMAKARSNMGAFLAIFGMFSVLMVASKFAGENASKAGGAIVKMSAGLLLIVAAFKMMDGMGDNTLSSFAKELDAFGPSLMSYANSVNGLDTTVIDASVAAAGALSALANGLPNSGGILAEWMGDNSLSSFGAQLIIFGNNLRAYSDAVSDVKPNVVTASANAAGALSQLAAGLPDSSLFDQWFGGDQTLASFGEDIAAFGSSMNTYNSYVSGIDSGRLSGVITQVWSLVDLAEGTKGLDTSGFYNFGAALSSMASSGVSDFTAAFTNAESDVQGAVGTMLGYVGTAINAKTPSFTAEVTNAVNGVVSNVVSAINQKRPQFVNAGVNLAQGFAQGIRSSSSAATLAATNMANATATATRRTLRIASPSKVFKGIGGFLVGGLATGILVRESVQQNNHDRQEENGHS